ncbi:MAG TPA: DUF5063 domain-containing protein [Gemmatimonadales bacterium]|jgi:hypothetical protein|nr:DUF5063 domain-containing protein [Gemmatimonadales bacterium]
MPRKALPPVQSPALTTFSVTAEEYCGVIEAREGLTREQFLQRVHEVLPRLYAAALALPSTDALFPDKEPAEGEDPAAEAVADPVPPPDRGRPEPWRELHTSLTSLIGDRNVYREIYDPYEPLSESEVTGSLADDLADIYRDVRAGLVKWARGESGEALWEWRFNFQIHWGEHLTGALRALYSLSSTYELDWPRKSGAA